MYEYKATVLSNHDGDTLQVKIFLGFDVSIEQTLRLYGIDTPEMAGKTAAEKAAAVKSRDRVTTLVVGKEVILRSKKPAGGDKYGRYLCSIIYEVAKDKDGKPVTADLATTLIAEGLGKAYFGDKKEAFTPQV